MGPDASRAASVPSALTENRCLVHSRARSIVPHIASNSSRMQHRTSSALHASRARPSLRGVSRPECGNSSRFPPCTIVYNKHRALPSISCTHERPATSHSSSLRHRCLPLDRRWQGRPLVGCLSDAVGPVAGSNETVHDAHEEHSMKQQHEPQPLLKVPWTAGKIFQVMFLWLLAFWALGYFALPNSLDLLGLERGDLSARGQALMHLLLDLGELGATLGILWRCLHAYRPLSLGWFRTRLRPLRSWICPTLLACAFFPLVDLAAARSQGWFPYDKELWGPNALEQSLASGDMISNAIYFVVVTVCAPIWEEAIFRGFLLPSLTKYMPVTAAIAVSALSFAGAHFSLQRFLPLVLLGVIFGALLVRTRNLLPCVLLHSLWNAYIFWQLTCRGTVVM